MHSTSNSFKTKTLDNTAPHLVGVDANGRTVRREASSITPSYKYTKEWHVDPVNGLDTNTGAEDSPFKTIARAQTVIVGSGDALHLHASIYGESVTWNDLNVDIIGASTGGLTRLEGEWTLAHASSSVRFRNVSIPSGFTHSGAGGLFLNECQCSGTINKTGAGYFEASDCDFGGTGINVTGAGFVNLYNTKANLINVNNASAVVTVQDGPNIVGPVVTAGTLGLIGCNIFAAGAASAAVGGQAASTIIMRNSACYKPDGTFAPVSFLGIWSIDDVMYDSAASVVTGTNLGNVARFDQINARGYLAGSSLFVTHNQARPFSAGVIVEKEGLLYKSNASIPANTPFAIGTTGQTWRALSSPGVTITYQTSSTTKPASPAKGDLLFVTQDGTNATAIAEQWLYDGTAWILVDQSASGGVVVSGSVLDNTIGNPDSISTAGRYIIPATGLSGAFVGHANKYADWYGETDPGTGLATGFTFALPTSGDKVVITAGSNAGKIFAFDGTSWTEQAGVAGVPAAGQLLTITNLATITSAGSPDSAWSNVSGGQFTIPGAGKWDVDYTLSFTNSTTNWVQTRLVNSLNVEVPGSRGTYGLAAQNTPYSIDGGAQIDLTADGTYRLQARTFTGSTITINNTTAQTGAAAQRGQSIIRWTKVVEFPPVVVDPTLVIPQTLSRMVIGYTASTGGFPAAGVAPIGTGAAPIITGSRFALDGNIIVVKAGGRVRLTGPVGGSFGSTGLSSHYWAQEGQSARYNPPNGHAVDGLYTSAAGNFSEADCTAILEFTPTADVRLQLYVSSSSGSYQLNADRGLITVEELPTMTVTGTVDTALTPVNDQISSEFFDIGNMRIQTGFDNQALTTTRTITLPAPFANNNYRITYGPTFNADGLIRSANTAAQTTTTFQVQVRHQNGPSTTGFSWIAIGRKP